MIVKPAIIFLGLTAAALGQQSGVELRLESRIIEPGESVNVQLICNNIGTPSIPEADVPPGLQLKLVNSSPSYSSRTSIINGRRSSIETHTFSLRLTATKEGTYTLGPMFVTAGGASHQSDSVTIVVRKSKQQTGQRGDRTLYAYIEVEQDSCYVSQRVKAALVIGIRKVSHNRRMYSLNNLNEMRQQTGIFIDGNATKKEVNLRDSGNRKNPYDVYRIEKSILAETPGELTIDPVFLKINFPTRLRQGFFGRLEVAGSRRETARAEGASVTVKAPPINSRPSDFNGAIGRYAMSVDVKPKRIQQGQPATLIISVRGAPLDSIAGPDLSAQAELASRFDFAKDELVGDIEGRAKVFRRAIFPKQAGEQTIPPISWSFFNSTTEKYVTLQNDPIDISVDAAAPGTTAFRSAESTTPDKDSVDLKVLAGGISPNYIDAGQALANQSPGWTTASAVWILAPPILWLVSTLALRHRARLVADGGYARRHKAIRTADNELKLAMQDGEPIDQMQNVAAALRGFVADQLNLPPGAKTPAEVKTLLNEQGVNGTLTDEIVEFLERCEAIRYAPDSLDAASPSESASNVREWIRQIERALR